MGLFDFLDDRRGGGLFGGLFPDPPQQQPDRDAGNAVPGFLGGVGHWLGDNSSTLIGLGAGLAGGRNWGEGLSKGLQNALTARALDRQRAAHEQTVAALMQRGLDEATAHAAAANPMMLRAVLWQLYAPQARSPSLQAQPSAPFGPSTPSVPGPAVPRYLDSGRYWGAGPTALGASAPPPHGFFLPPIP